MISRFRVTTESDTHGLPRSIRKIIGTSQKDSYLDPDAPPFVQTNHIDLIMVTFRQDVSYSQRAIACGQTVPLSEMFHEMIVFCEWLKNHADYEFCGSYVTNRPDEFAMATVFTFTVIAYVCGNNANSNNTQGIFTNEFKRSIVQTGIPPLAGRDVDAEFLKAFGTTLHSAPPQRKPKVVVTFSQALDIAKELGL